MSLFLLIDTAGPDATVALAKDGIIIAERSNSQQREHASFLQPAIQALLTENNLQWSGLNAVAVSNGPGSYTGLRVGLASAKGICFAHKLPLICLSTLEILAEHAISGSKNDLNEALFVPMIDARRMEVYTAGYNQNLEIVLEPQALILETDSYFHLLEKNKIIFFGDGSPKWEAVCKHPNAFFLTVPGSISLGMARLTGIYFDKSQFSDVAYSEPFYIKNFHDTAAGNR